MSRFEVTKSKMKSKVENAKDRKARPDWYLVHDLTETKNLLTNLLEDDFDKSSVDELFAKVNTVYTDNFKQIQQDLNYLVKVGPRDAAVSGPAKEAMEGILDKHASSPKTVQIQNFHKGWAVMNTKDKFREVIKLMLEEVSTIAEDVRQFSKQYRKKEMARDIHTKYYNTKNKEKAKRTSQNRRSNKYAGVDDRERLGPVGNRRPNSRVARKRYAGADDREDRIAHFHTRLDKVEVKVDSLARKHTRKCNRIIRELEA